MVEDGLRKLIQTFQLQKNNMKIALALIAKGSDEEAVSLNRCLGSIAPYVDKVFITSTYKKGQKPNKQIEKVALSFGAELSTFEWVNDFSKARNFNFSQVPKEYDYIMWCDADDQIRGAEKLKDTVDANPVDAYGMWYLYDFDERKNPTVVHKKTMIVKNDGTFEWVGRLHEDLTAKRAINIYLLEGIDRLHFTDDDRVNNNKKRNVEIAKAQLKDEPNDPRSYWNLANSYWGNGQIKEALKTFETFIGLSQSDEEKYLATLRMALLNGDLGRKDKAENLFYVSIGMKPHYPDAYVQAGYFFQKIKDYDKAEYYLLRGLQIKPPYHSIIVYNPRDYDYNPMMALAKVYMWKGREDLSLPLLEGCSKIAPEDESLKELVKEMKEAKDKLENVAVFVDEIKDLPDEQILEKINALPTELRSHPSVCHLRNTKFAKKESSGKDIAYFCGLTDHEWNPELFKTKGFGGSEEAVINLSKEWTKLGYNVTVYNNCGPYEMESDGVKYKPFWMWNYRDKQDIVILWRHPQMLDHEINADKIYVDMHDVIPNEEFTEKRVSRATKIFVKTKFHKSLFPNIPEEKIEVVPNGMDFELFNQTSGIFCERCNGQGECGGENNDDKLCDKCNGAGVFPIKKDPMLLVNTSSPDRSMDVMPKLFKMIKEQVPEVKMKWAYGWDIFDQHYGSNKQMMEWRNKLQKEIDEAGIESLGKIPQQECAKLYLEGNILAYPSEFAEIDCISVKKAQACGCIPVTTDFGAFNESVQHGIKIHSDKTKDNWAKPYQSSFGIDNEDKQKEWVDAVVKILKEPITDRSEMIQWTEQFNWNLIAKKWLI